MTPEFTDYFDHIIRLNLTPSAKILLIWMVKEYGTDEFSLSASQICMYVGISARSVQRQINVLHTKGLLHKEGDKHNSGMISSNKYRVLL